MGSPAANPKRVYFDNNALGSLYEPRQGRTAGDLVAVRRNLADQVRAGSLIAVISYNSLEEFTPVYLQDPARYLATIDYVRPLVGRNLILCTDLLLEAEARARRPLRYDECVFDVQTRVGLWRLARSPKTIAEVVPETTTEKQRYSSVMVQQSERAKEIYSEKKFDQIIFPNGRTQKLEEVFYKWGKKELRGQIDQWTRETLALLVDEGQLPPKARGLEVSALPTLRNMTAYFAARIARNLSKQAKVKGSDSYDHHHYAAGRYTDLIVSDDADFKETAALIDKSFPIKTFDEFSAELALMAAGAAISGKT